MTMRGCVDRFEVGRLEGSEVGIRHGSEAVQ